MPNGWTDTRERFAELEAPLLALDGLFSRFASVVGGANTSNYHDHPERRIRLRDDAFSRYICISVVTGGPNFQPGPNGAEYIFWGGVHHDVADGRWSWHKTFLSWPIIPGEDQVEADMWRAWQQVEAVHQEDMTFHHDPYRSTNA